MKAELNCKRECPFDLSCGDCLSEMRIPGYANIIVKFNKLKKSGIPYLLTQAEKIDSNTINFGNGFQLIRGFLTRW